MHSPRWPRPWYLKEVVPEETLSALREHPEAALLIRLLTAPARDEQLVCQEAIQLARRSR